MSRCHRFLTFRSFLPLLAAGALAACGSDPSAFGEPFSLSTTDAGAEHSLGNAGKSGQGAGAGGAAAGSGGQSAAGRGGSGGASIDAGVTDDDGDSDDDHGGEHVAGSGGSGGAGGSAGHAAGSGGSGGNGGNGGNGGAAAVSFGDIFTNTIAAGCSCHSGGAGGLDLGSRATAYKNLVNVASGICAGEQRVVPGNADASVLFHAISHTALGSCKVPNMPQGRNMLTQAQLDQIQAWIAAGAPDN